MTVDDTFGGDPLGAGQIVEVSDRLADAGVPDGANAVTFAIQVTATTGSGYVEVTSRPDDFGLSSTVSWLGADQRESSSGVVGLIELFSGDDGFYVFFDGGDDLPRGHVVLDVTGYFVDLAT